VKPAKLTVLTLILLFLMAGQRQIKYFLNQHDFITGHNVPKSEVINKPHIQAEYDQLDRLVIKNNINEKRIVTAQEQYSYIDNSTTIRQKDLVDDSGHIFYQTIFGREPQSISYIEWVFGLDSVKKWDDRFTTSDMNKIDKPDNYRFYDVNAFEYGVPPHAGCGIGLERLMMALTGTENIRDTTFYPRDVDRLTP